MARGKQIHGYVQGPQPRWQDKNNRSCPVQTGRVILIRLRKLKHEFFSGASRLGLIRRRRGRGTKAAELRLAAEDCRHFEAEKLVRESVTRLSPIHVDNFTEQTLAIYSPYPKVHA